MKDGVDGWDEGKRDQYALLAMVGLGAGEIIGALGFARILDKFSSRITIAANMLAVVLAFSLLLGYTFRYEYSLPFGFFMTFFWGI